jgi:hypothetical protein
VRWRGTLYGEGVPAAAATAEAAEQLAHLLSELVAFPTETVLEGDEVGAQILDQVVIGGDVVIAMRA